MRCEFIFCIYNKDDKCTVDDVGIDSCGVCDSALYLEIDEKELQRLKNKTLDKYDSYRR